VKVAICGSAVSSAHLAPVDDPDWEIWATSPQSMNQLKRVTRWFEVHVWDDYIKRYKAYVKFLKEFKGPVYTGGPTPIPNALQYPIEEVEKEFTSYFLTSSIALMMALALLEKAEIIGLYGIDMAEREEYTKQRPGCHFFILEALKRGVGIYVPKESCLLRPQPVYGLCEWSHNYIQSRQRSLLYTAEIREMQQNKRMMEKRIDQFSSACEDIDYMVNMWNSPYGLPSGKVIKGDK
jgi:hypothetical protein